MSTVSALVFEPSEKGLTNTDMFGMEASALPKSTKESSVSAILFCQTLDVCTKHSDLH